MKDQTDKGIVEETRELYDRLSSLTEGDRRAARRRGPVVKALMVVCLLAAILASAALVYGVIAFPDAPIRVSGSSYVGKHGAVHTREHYERFKLWEKLMFSSFGLAFITGLSAVAAEKLSQRSKVTN